MHRCISMYVNICTDSIGEKSGKCASFDCCFCCFDFKTKRKKKKQTQSESVVFRIGTQKNKNNTADWIWDC